MGYRSRLKAKICLNQASLESAEVSKPGELEGEYSVIIVERMSSKIDTLVRRADIRFQVESVKSFRPYSQ